MADQTRAQGRRKSKFPALTTIPGDATLDFVSNGTNFKITLSDFLAALNVTGTIVQDGAVTGTPILDTQGTVNNIRNLESGSGISTSVSPENGATIEHNFTVNEDGVPVMINKTAASPTFRSISAGTGISVTLAGDDQEEIEISVSGLAASTKTVVVNELSDFPTPSAGIITLAGETEYLLTNDINIGTNRFVFANDTVISGADSSVITLTYTGTGDMFTANDATCRIDSITITCATGNFINLTDSVGDKLFQLFDMTISSCDTIGTIDGYGAVQMNNVAFFNIVTNGLLFVGNIGAFVGQTNILSINLGTVFDLGTSVIGAFSLSSSLINLIGAGTFLLSGLTGSANIQATGLGSILNTRIGGAGTALNNITSGDDRWDFQLNDEIQDSRVDALLSVNGNATETAIATINTAIKVNTGSTWVDQGTSQFTVDTTGRATYSGPKNARLPITISCTALMASGGANDVTFYVAINGSIVTASGGANSISSSQAGRTTVIWQHNFEPDDFVELWAENNSGTTNIVVTDANLRVN